MSINHQDLREVVESLTRRIDTAEENAAAWRTRCEELEAQNQQRADERAKEMTEAAVKRAGEGYRLGIASAWLAQNWGTAPDDATNEEKIACSLRIADELIKQAGVK